jgi:hypothetical protein
VRRYRLTALILALTAVLSFTTVPARAETGVSIDFFVDTLSPHGEWVEHPRHGRVWYPRDVDYDWRPYTRGHWANTEEHGWMWVSDEEWGWGPYHYGRWDFDDRYGWVWVPGYEWGPAWVEWRSGGGHIGWAPLSPAASFVDGRIVYAERFDYFAPRYRPAWVFVPEVHFLRPRLYSFCVPPARNVTIINRTTNVTNYTVVNQTVINKSVTVQHIAAVTKQQVPVTKIVQVNNPVAGQAAGSQRPNSVSLFRPVVNQGGKPQLAQGVTTAAIVQSAKAAAPPKTDGQPPKPNAAAATAVKQVEGAAPAASQQKALPNKTAAVPPVNKAAKEAAPPAKPPVALKSDAPAASARTTAAPPPGDDSRLKTLQERQKAERAAMVQRQQQDRSKAALLQKPGVIRDQFRERSEQRRIEAQQRKVVQNRPVPPRVTAQPPRQPVPVRQAQKKPTPNGQQPPR